MPDSVREDLWLQRVCTDDDCACSNLGSETAYPRLSMITDLIAALTTYPTLSRTATSALSELCEAMKDSASEAEIDALLSAAMTEEVHVRFACLQAIQVRGRLCSWKHGDLLGLTGLCCTATRLD